MRPPKPKPRAEKVSLWQYMRLFRRDILSAQPAKLYRAWMAEFRTVFFRSYLINQPDLIRDVLNERPEIYPKSPRIGEGLRPLLGQSVFLTNGETWERQRRIIDPAFQGGRLRDTYPAMHAAAEAGLARLANKAGQGLIEVEEMTSHIAADMIFRTLFSIPIENEMAGEVFRLFREHQRSQPILNLAAFVPLPAWVPRPRRRNTRRTAKQIRTLIAELTAKRLRDIKDGVAPDDLATKIMTAKDPITGECFSVDEMVDQVAIFFLAGHETSASALAWSLYLLARSPHWQDRLADEAANAGELSFETVARLRISRDVFRETLRLYPPVPMMVRENGCPVNFRGRDIAVGSQIVISPWHLHRHERLWEAPDDFDPGRWQTKAGKCSARAAFIPFSTGRRVCIGAGFAMVEGPLMLATILRRYRITIAENGPPIPVAHLTVRSKDGIYLIFTQR